MTRLLLEKNSKLVNYYNNQKSVDSLNDDDVVYFCDHFDINTYHSVKDRYGAPSRIVFDIECSVEPQEFDAIFIPGMEMGLQCYIKQFNKSGLTFSDSVKTTRCCNFSINKKSYPRHLVLKLVDSFFPDIDANYTWHGKTRDYDMSCLLEELDINSLQSITGENVNSLSYKLFSPVSLPANWGYNTDFENKFIDYRVTDKNHVDNWNVAHKDQCETSAVCLVAENFSNRQKNYKFTEKTLYGILGLNFLIWTGNYGNAEQAKRMGLDIFEDIIDHSYQYEETVFERCYYAVQRNIQILTDLEFANDLRNTNLNRLIENRNYCLGGGFRQWAQQQINKNNLEHLVTIS